MKSYFPHAKIIAVAQSINIKQLPWVLYIERKMLPNSGGIYFVGTDNDPTAYIGKAECFKTRFPGHHKKEAFNQLINEFGQENVKIRYWNVPSMPKNEVVIFLAQLESYLIENSKTRFNNTPNSLPKTRFHLLVALTSAPYMFS